MSDETTKKELQSVDTNTMPWGELYIEQLKTGIPVFITNKPFDIRYAFEDEEQE